MISDDDYTGDSTHRFYQDWQQEDCSVANADQEEQFGLPERSVPVRDGDLFGVEQEPWRNSMGFYNAQQGQAPVLKMLADRFTLSDNFHQSFHGGTGANHFMLGTGDAAFWSDGKGNAGDAAGQA